MKRAKWNIIQVVFGIQPEARHNNGVSYLTLCRSLYIYIYIYIYIYLYLYVYISHSVQEFCNKGTLSQAVVKGWLLEDGLPARPNLVAVLQTAGDVARAMNYLHQFNIIHGDLTCEYCIAQGFSLVLKPWSEMLLYAPVGVGAGVFTLLE